MNRKVIRFILGSLMQIEAVFFLFPLLTAVIYGERTGWVFLGMTGFCLLTGRLVKGKRPENTNIYSFEGYVTVALCWIVLSICGAMPLYFSGSVTNPVDALFEIVSGFTTTGATIFSDVEVLPRSILLWRSFSHWIGGMGVLVFMLALLPMAGSAGMYLMKAESPGPSVGKLVPKVRSTAKLLYMIYFFLTVLEMALLMLAGCPVFDSVNLAMATAGTGGFGVLNSSAGDYNALVQLILSVFMIMFGVNFNIYFLVVIGNVKEALHSEELRTYLGVIAGAVILVAVNTAHLFENAGQALLHALFQVASIITTTGFATVDFDLWPELSRTILVLLMFIGACAGSTGGGLKVSRVVIMVKSVVKEFIYLLHPRNVKKTYFEGKPVEHEVMRSINVFLITYLGIFIVSVLILALDDHDGITNVTAVASAMNNIGPGLSLVGPTCNFSFFSNRAKLVLIFDMLAGRLEIFPILVLVAVGLERIGRRGNKW